MPCGCAPRRRVAPGVDDVDELVGEHELLASSAAHELVPRIARSGGLRPEARSRLWPLLLGVDAWEATDAQRQRSAADRAASYDKLSQGAANVDKKDATVIAADVPRTDRDVPRWSDDASLEPLRALLLAHCVHLPKLGYVQGMNDLAAIVCDAYVAPRADHFWLFEAVLDSSACRAPPTDSHRGALSLAGRARARADASSWAADDEFAGVWEQTRAVAAVVAVAAPRLARHVAQVEATRSAELAQAQPLGCLFQAVLLRLKREMAGQPVYTSTPRATTGPLGSMPRAPVVSPPSRGIDLRGSSAAARPGPTCRLPRFQSAQADYEEVRRLWEGGRHFQLLLLAAVVLRQEAALLRLPPTLAGFGEMHRHFMQLAGTLRAAPLLRAARALQAQPGVAAALASPRGERAATEASRTGPTASANR